MRASLFALAASLALAGCTFTATPDDGAAAQQAPAVTLTASGEPQTLRIETDNEHIQWAASVVRVDYIANQEPMTVKMFGMAGGDPAMNGLYTEIAIFESSADGWRVFRIGDFLDYRILSSDRGRVDLEVQESTMNAETSEIGSQTRHLIVTWRFSADGAAPTVTVTPATAS